MMTGCSKSFHLRSHADFPASFASRSPCPGSSTSLGRQSPLPVIVARRVPDQFPGHRSGSSGILSDYGRCWSRYTLHRSVVARHCLGAGEHRAVRPPSWRIRYIPLLGPDQAPGIGFDFRHTFVPLCPAERPTRPSVRFSRSRPDFYICPHRQLLWCAPRHIFAVAAVPFAFLAVWATIQDVYTTGGSPMVHDGSIYTAACAIALCGGWARPFLTLSTLVCTTTALSLLSPSGFCVIYSNLYRLGTPCFRG